MPSTGRSRRPARPATPPRKRRASTPGRRPSGRGSTPSARPASPKSSATLPCARRNPRLCWPPNRPRSTARSRSAETRRGVRGRGRDRTAPHRRRGGPGAVAAREGEARRRARRGDGAAARQARRRRVGRSHQIRGQDPARQGAGRGQGDLGQGRSPAPRAEGGGRGQGGAGRGRECGERRGAAHAARTAPDRPDAGDRRADGQARREDRLDPDQPGEWARDWAETAAAQLRRSTKPSRAS